MSDKKIKVLIAGNDAALIDMLTPQAKDIANVEVCGTVKTKTEFLSAYSSSQVDVLFLDLSFDDDTYMQLFKIIENDVNSGRLSVISVAFTSDINKIRKAMKAGCSDFLVLPVKNDELSNSIHSAYEKTVNAKRAIDAVAGGKSARQRSGKIITIFSTKGGVGKSTIATNLAVMLANVLKKHDRRVALMDAKFQFGDIGWLLNLNPTQNKSIYELIKEMGEPKTLSIDVLEEFLAKHSSGLEVLLAPAQPQYAEEIRGLFLGNILECLKKNFDYLIIDTSNFINENELTFIDFTNVLLVISTLEVTTIKNLVSTLEILKDLQYPKENIFLVLNRAYQKMGIEPSMVESKLMKISSYIPSDGERVVSSLNNGMPFVTDMKFDIPIVKAIFDLAQFVATDEDKQFFSDKPAQADDAKNILNFFKKLIKN
ncbi:MAG: AAA family ATPase [Candidatus Wallbacteria bacterium]